MTCPICDSTSVGRQRVMCIVCCEAYDRARRRDDGTVGAAMAWAAGRARRAERTRIVAAVAPVLKDAAASVADELYCAGPEEVDQHPSYKRKQETLARAYAMLKWLARVHRGVT